jgi:tetratricopeptide (TPR) repeat protein
VELMAIKGSLKEASLPDVVQLLFLGRRTGCLSVASEHNFGSIWFDEGWITFAGMVSRIDRIGERFVAAGLITAMQLEEAVAAQVAMPGRRLGEMLVHLGLVTAGELEAELRRQVEECIYTLFSWTSGTFSFEVGAHPDVPDAVLRLNPEGLLLEGARRVDEWSVIAKKITTVDAVYAVDGGPRTAADDDAHLVESERRVLPLINGINTVREIVDGTGLSEFEVCRVLFGLLSAGRLRRVSTAPPPPQREDLSRIDEHRNLGIAFYRTGMFAEAEREFRRVNELRATDPMAPFHLGLIALRQARWNDAVDFFQRAAERDSSRVAVLHNLALALEAAGRLDDAETALAEALQRNTHDARLWTAFGLLALRRDEPARALERFARARDLLGGIRPPAHWYWGCGWAQGLSEAWPDAVGTMREGVKAFPDHPVLRTTLGVLLEGTGEVGEAEAHLRHALGEDPTIPQISKNLGDLLYRAGRWDEAEESFERATKLAPGLGDDIYFKLGNLACRRGDLVAARLRWEEAIRLNPEHALARANLAGAGTSP